MNKKNIIIIVLSFIIVILLTVVITLTITNNKDAKKTTIKQPSESKIKEELKEDNKEEIEIKEEETIDNNTNNNNSSSNGNKIEENKPNNVVVEEPKQEINTNDTTTAEEEISTPEIVKTEANVVNYAEGLTNNKTTIKEGFVKLVDFIFYDGEIYGKTFKELTNSAKLKIIAAAIKVDTKIEEYYPGYKESISSTTNKIYTNVKSKLVTLYLDTTVKICNNNPTTCEDAKQGLNELKQNFGLTWTFIKDISGVGLTKLKDWYNVWKEK